MALPMLLGAGARAAGGAMVKSGGKAMAKKMFGRKDKNAQQAQPEIQEVNVKVVNDKPQTGNQISGMSSFLSLPSAKMIAGGSGKGVSGVEEKLKSIRDLFAERFAYSKKKSRQEQVEKGRSGKEKREKDLEKAEKEEKSKSGSKAKLPKVGLFDSIRNFLLYTLLGFLERRFNFSSQLVKILPLIGGVMEFVSDWGGKILNGLATLIEVGYGLVDKTRGFVKTIGGDGLLKVFDKVLGAINTVLNLLFVYAMAQNALGFGGDGANKKDPNKPRSRPGTDGRSKVTGTRAERIKDKITKPFRERPKVTGQPKGFFGTLKDRLTKPFQKKPKITGDVAKKPGFFSKASDAVGGVGKKLRGVGAGLLEGIGATGKNVIKGLDTTGKNVVKGIGDAGKIAVNVGKGAIDLAAKLGKGASDLYKNTVVKLKDAAGGLINKGKDALFEWLSKQGGVLGKVGKAAPDLLKKLGKYLPFVGDVVGFVFDIVEGIDWRRALIRAVTGATIDAGFTALMGALGVATPFTGGASGLLAAAIYGAYMAADIAAGGFGRILGDKISDFFKLPMRAGEKGGDAPPPKAPGSEADVKKVQEELAKKAASDAEFAKKIGGNQKATPQKPQTQQPATPPATTEAKSRGGFVSAYEDGGEVSEQDVEKKLLKTDDAQVTQKSSSGSAGGKVKKSEGLGGFFAGLFGQKKDEFSGQKSNAGSDYLTETGSQFAKVPIVGSMLALAINKLLGNDVSSRDFDNVANSITNFATLSATGFIHSSGDYEKYVRAFATGGTVDVSSGLGDTMEVSRSLSRFLETKFDALNLPDPPDAPAGAGSYGTTGARGQGEYDSATGAFMGGGSSGGGGFDTRVAKLLENYEGLRTEAYPDPYTKAKPYTIGIGATKYPPGFRLSGEVKLGDTITKEEAYQIKAHDIKRHTNIAISEVGSDVWNKLPDNVKAALISKAFNYGSLQPTLSGLVTTAASSGDYKPVADYFRNTLAAHNGGINNWRRNDEAGIIEGGKSNRSGISFPKSAAEAQIAYAPESSKVSPGTEATGKDGKPVKVGGGSIVSIGKDLISKGFAVAEHPDFTKKTPSGSYTPGAGHVSNVHKGRGHYEGRAIDVTDWRGSLEDSKGRYRSVLTSLQNNPAINMLIHDSWGGMYSPGQKQPPGSHGHPTHMHIETKKEGGGLIGRSTKDYGDMTAKASYERSGGTSVVFQPIIIEKQSPNNFMMNPMDKITFGASNQLNNTNAVASRG